MKRSLRNNVLTLIVGICIFSTGWSMDQKTSNRVNVLINHINGNQDKQLVLNTTSDKEEQKLFDEIHKLTDEQIEKLDATYVKNILQGSASLAAQFVKKIKNHKKFFGEDYIDTNVFIKILNADRSCAEILLKNCYYGLMFDMRRNNTSAKTILMEAVNENNFSEISISSVLFFLHPDQSFLKKYADFVNENNITTIDANFFKELLQADPSHVKKFTSLINETNIQKDYYNPNVETLAKTDLASAHFIMQCITKDNAARISESLLAYLEIVDTLAEFNEIVATKSLKDAAQYIKTLHKGGFSSKSFFSHISNTKIYDLVKEDNDCAAIFLKYCPEDYFCRYIKSSYNSNTAFMQVETLFKNAINQNNFTEIGKNGLVLYNLCDRQDAQQWVSWINAHNIRSIDSSVITKIIDTNPAFAMTIAKNALTKDNIDDLNSEYGVIGKLIEADSKTSSYIAPLIKDPKSITTKNFSANKLNVYIHINNDPSLASYFANMLGDPKAITQSDMDTKYFDTFPIFVHITADPSLASYFAQLINPNNFRDLRYKLMPQLLQADSACAKIIAQNAITLQSLKNDKYTQYYVKDLIKADDECAKIIAKNLITKENLVDNDDIISMLLEYSPSIAHYFMSWIDIATINKSLLYKLIEADPSCVKILATNTSIQENLKDYENIICETLRTVPTSAVYFVSLIDASNMEKHTKLINALLRADTACAYTIAQSCINESSLFGVPKDILFLLAKANLQAKDYIKKIKGFDQLFKAGATLNNEPLEIAIFAPEQIQKNQDNSEFKKLFQQTWSSNKTFIGTANKKGASWQHFVQNYVDVINKFAEQLKDKQLAQALFKMLKREWMEQEKERYVLYHAQKMDTAYCNMIYTRLLELYYGKKIDKESWFAPRCNMLDQNLPYDRLADLVKNGRTTKEQRSHLQFTNAGLFSNTGRLGSCSFGYLADNDNVGSFKFTPEELFKQFNLEKYAKKYKHVFDQLAKLVEQCKKGTMLMYSFTREALDRFTYATSSSGGYKSSMQYGSYQLMINGKNAIDAPTHEIIDTLRNNPEHFDKQNHNKELNYSDAHEYVIVITDDHPSDETKLGSANPFNQDMRCYHVHVEPQAYLIEKILDQLFEKIKEDIKQDKIMFMKIQQEMYVPSNL